MSYGLLANLVVLVHFGFILFAALGGLFALRWRWIPWVHLPVVAWAAFIELSGRVCPLTPLENRLRAEAGDAAYTGDFIAYYLGPVIYPPGLTREVQILLAVLLVVINSAVYWIVWRRRCTRASTAVASVRKVHRA